MSLKKDLNRKVILLAEDNPADQHLTRRALEDVNCPHELVVVRDGEDALEYLTRSGKYADSSQCPYPDLVLLDINMPKINGKEVLKNMRADNRTRHIPVLVLTTSNQENDVQEAYRLGANAYITKPDRYDGFIEIAKAIKSFWLRMVSLPPR
ncbi:MAG: response regulator [Candidatus Sumerlaeia bacterium]